MGPDPAVAAVRLAVRGALGDVPDGLVLAACSGGGDSLALAAALAFEAPRAGRAAGGVTVDHGLQPGSAAQAERVVRAMAGLGLDPAGSVAVQVGGEGGPEAAARRARYAALDGAAARLGGAVVLLGHTLDDQAETVLLGLGRGSGARSLAGMPRIFRREEIVYVRPLLNLDRATTLRACAAQGLEPWQDPHNDDRSYTRVRVRRDALPALRQALGPGVPAALARTAAQLSDDADALDGWAAGVAPDADVTELARLPKAVRTRVLRARAVAAGCPPGALAAVHIAALDRLVTAWHGQRQVDLPGGVRAFRSHGMLEFA